MCPQKRGKIKPNLVISRIKRFVDDQINNTLKITGEVSFSDLYVSLQDPPYGLMDCNLTAFILGFVLKEYVQNEGEFYCSDGDVDDVLTQDKLSALIEEVIKNSITPPSRSKTKFIKEKSQEETIFAEATATIFQVSASSCFVGKVRELLRTKMKTLGFPIWCLSEVVDGLSFSVSKEIIRDLIAKYVGVANIENYSNGNTREAQLVKEIGSTFIKYPDAISDMAALVNRENCLKGMRNYVASYKGGELVTLSRQIGAGDNYLENLQEKYDKVDAANWAWNKETADGIIDDVIIECRIVNLSRSYGVNAISFCNLKSAWSDKLKQCRISYDAVKNKEVEENQLFELMVALRKTENIANPAEFLELLDKFGGTLGSFFEPKATLFKKVAEVYLVELKDYQKDEVFLRMPADLFADDKSSYLKKVEETVEDYLKNLGRQKLRETWNSKAGKDTPFDWSLYYETPVLALVPKAEINDAKKHFAVVNSHNPDKIDTEKALSYLESITWWDDLASQEKREESFAMNVLQEYSALITVEDAKKYLKSAVNDEPYHWWSNEIIRSKLKDLAQTKYDTSGAAKALKIIEEIGNSEKVKNYLERLIKGNMTIGLEIIGEKKED
jgi:hypothetical protein